MGGRDGELSFFGKISKTLPLCGLLWGTGADSAHSWSGDKVDGGEFPVAGDADGGGYAVQPTWEDGHGTGIYSWEYLRKIGEAVS